MGEKRFGVALLGTRRIDEAEEGEALASRDTGLVGVAREKGGSFVSYDYITRFMNAYSQFKSKLIASGNIGFVAKLELSAKEPFVIMQNDVSVTASDMLVTSVTKLGFVRFYPDICIVNNKTGIPVDCVPTINIKFSVAHNKDNATSISYNATGDLNDIRDRAFVPNYTDFENLTDAIDRDFVFESIKATLPVGVKEDDVTIILNSLLVSYGGGAVT